MFPNSHAPEMPVQLTLFLGLCETQGKFVLAPTVLR